MPLRINGCAFAAATAVLAFLLMAGGCSALHHHHHHHHRMAKRVNKIGGPYIGILMTFPTEERAIQESGFFTPNPVIPYVDLAGRRFNVGKIKGVDVIYVMSGEQTLNAGMTVQMLVDVFMIKGIVHYGIAGSTNESLLVGDVSVPKYAAYTGSWHWMEVNSTGGNWEHLPVLTFGDFSLPEPGENKLAELYFSITELLSVGKPLKRVFWVPVDPEWFAMASQLKNVSLERCINATSCLPQTPKLVHGLRASTADIFVHNVAYRSFLFKKFHVSTADEETSAVMTASLSNAVPCIVFRGISDSAGAAPAFPSSALEYLAAKNAVLASVEFIALFNK